jgi:hypothetical protein
MLIFAFAEIPTTSCCDPKGSERRSAVCCSVIGSTIIRQLAANNSRYGDGQSDGRRHAGSSVSALLRPGLARELSTIARRSPWVFAEVGWRRRRGVHEVKEAGELDAAMVA